MDEQLHEQIAFYLYRERVMNMGVFDAWFSKEALEKRKQEPPTDAEQLAAQHRSDMIAMLSDFSLAWGGHPEMIEVAPGQFATGVKEVDGPTSVDLSAYRAAQHKDTITIAGNGWSLSRDEFDNVMVRTSQGIVAIPSTEWANFVRAVMTIPQGAPHLSGSSYVASNDSVLPTRKSQTELVAEQTGSARENAERMEYSTRMQRESGIWGSTKRDGR